MCGGFSCRIRAGTGKDHLKTIIVFKSKDVSSSEAGGGGGLKNKQTADYIFINHMSQSMKCQKLLKEVHHNF